MIVRDQSGEGLNQDRQTPWQRLLGLRHHSLIRFAAAYGVVAWLIVQVAATVGPAFSLPSWFLRAVIGSAVLGFLLMLGGTAIIARQRPSDRSGGRQRRWLLGASLAGLVSAVGALGFFARDAVLGNEQVIVAVVPFSDLSPGHDKAYFAEGVAEEILSSLASERAIKVLGRTSARQLDREAGPQSIRASLGVTHLLEGSTRTAGDELRVNVRLIDTADGERIWEEKYQGRVADIFSVQDRIAATVVKRLRGTLASDGPSRSAEPTPIDAYQAYLAARALMRDPKKGPLTQALRLARQIVDTHPDYALGHALLSEATWLLADDPLSYGDIPADKARRIALAHAREAIRLDPGRAEGYSALGLASPPAQAIAPLRKAIDLDRSWVVLRGRLGLALGGLNRHDEAFEQYQLAVEIDPLASGINNRYIFALAVDGKREEALDAIALYLRRGGSEAQAARFRGNVFGQFGDLAASLAARRRALSLDPDLPYQHEWLAIGLHLLGFNQEAATYSPRVSHYFQLFVADDRGALRSQLARDGASAWSANGIDNAIFSLGRARDWPAIVHFYDVRPDDWGDLCPVPPRFTLFIGMALNAQGRAGEGRRLLSCVQRSVDAQLKMKHRWPDGHAGELEMSQASLMALRGDARAFEWLGKAVDRGWIGQYYSSSLADWPQFDRLRGDARYSAIQGKIDSRVEKERNATRRMLASRQPA